MEKIPSIPVVRHLDDIDDLKTFGRDGELLPNQEPVAKELAKELVESMRQEEKSALFLLCSPAKRGIQTGELIAQEVADQNPSTRCAVSEHEALANMYEGVPNLPADYQAGDKFPGYSIGKKAFANEVFGAEPNFLYRFGDPVLLEDGVYKYPELVGSFAEYGESYKDFFVRLLKLILETSDNLDRLKQKTKIAVVTHSLQYQILFDLQAISDDVLSKQVNPKPGELPGLCWQKYQERLKMNPPTYNVRYIDIEGLCNPEIVFLLQRELDYLNSLT